MSIVAKPTKAPQPRSEASKQISIVYAGLLVVMAVAQLYTFESFLELLQGMELPVSAGVSVALGSIIVVREVFALPFLLRMSLSKAFRYVSMFLGWLTAALWLFITTWVVAANAPVETVGFLGTLVELIPGWWAVLISLAFGVLAAWSSWGLWPGKRTRK